MKNIFKIIFLFLIGINSYATVLYVDPVKINNKNMDEYGICLGYEKTHSNETFKIYLSYPVYILYETHAYVSTKIDFPKHELMIMQRGKENSNNYIIENINIKSEDVSDLKFTLTYMQYNPVRENITKELEININDFLKSHETLHKTDRLKWLNVKCNDRKTTFL